MKWSLALLGIATNTVLLGNKGNGHSPPGHSCLLMGKPHGMCSPSQQDIEAAKEDCCKTAARGTGLSQVRESGPGYGGAKNFSLCRKAAELSPNVGRAIEKKD